MFAVEGWNLGDVVTQTLPKKKPKRKRDETTETNLEVGQQLINASRVNPFTLQQNPGSQYPNIPDNGRKVPKKSSPGLIVKDKKEREHMEALNQLSRITSLKQSKNAKKRQRKLKSEPFGTESGSVQSSHLPQPSSTPKPATTTLTPLQRKMRAKLAGSQFRHINEKLYTTHSSEALTLFTDDPSLFDNVWSLRITSLTVVPQRISTSSSIMAY